MSVLGYQPYAPTEYSQKVLQAAKQILIEYEAWERPMTVRQIFYRLVAQYKYEKTEQAYKSLGGYIARSRRAYQAHLLGLMREGINQKEATKAALREPLLIPFPWIRDERGQSHEVRSYDDVDSYVEFLLEDIERLQMDRSRSQPRHMELWCEANGMVPLMREIAQGYGLRVSSGGGYDSVTAKHKLAQRILTVWATERRPTTLFHIGDFDPSGEGMFESLREDVVEMCWQYTGVQEVVEFERMGLTEEQVLERDLETAPPKKTDSRYRGFLAAHPDIRDHYGSDNITVQLEALAPPELVELVQHSIEEHVDREALTEMEEVEDKLRDRIRDRLDVWPADDDEEEEDE